MPDHGADNRPVEVRNGVATQHAIQHHKTSQLVAKHFRK